MGYLHAEPKAKSDGGVEMASPSRFKQYLEAGEKPPLPKLPRGAEYLVKAMFSLGPTRALPMGGLRPADWQEIWPFIQASRAVDPGWEADALSDMCEAYFRGHESGMDPRKRSPMEVDQRSAELTVQRTRLVSPM